MLGTQSYRIMEREFRADPRRAFLEMREALNKKQLRPRDIRLRPLAEALCGREWVESLNPNLSGGFIPLLETGGAVNTAQFANITGQFLYNELMAAYQAEEFILSMLVKPTQSQFERERIPGIGQMGDNAEIVGEGREYPLVGLNEDYTDTPTTTKRGFIIGVTKEAIFHDRTGLVMDRAQEVGNWLGVNKEKRLIDIAIGVTNNYSWRGTTYNTYQTSTPWINTKTSHDLVDWTNVDASEQLFANILDPNTSEPVVVSPKQTLHTPARKHAAARVFRATDIAQVDNQANASTVRTFAPNPLDSDYQPYASRLFYRRLVAASIANPEKFWLHGDFGRAFGYMQNWPITIVQAQANGEAEFARDIVARFKVSEKGVAFVRNPRYVVKNTG